jgi:hypothetical protein
MKTSVMAFASWRSTIGNFRSSKRSGTASAKGKVKTLQPSKKRKKRSANENKRDYAAFAYSIISKVLNLVPTDMRIENLTFKLDDNGKKAKIDIKKTDSFDKEMETSINVQTNTFHSVGE